MSIVIAIILVTLTGLLCSVMLVVASHFMMVPKNEKEEKLRRSAEYAKNAKPGSLASKANLVSRYNSGSNEDNSEENSDK